MKDDIHANNPYMEVPFDTLMFLVFSPAGDLKRCPWKARTALIRRLECYYRTDGFGNARTGNINEMDAYIAGVIILRHNNGA